MGNQLIAWVGVFAHYRAYATPIVAPRDDGGESAGTAHRSYASNRGVVPLLYPPIGPLPRFMDYIVAMFLCSALNRHITGRRECMHRGV